MQVGHQLNAAIADVRDRIDRFGESVFLEGVGGKSEIDHGGIVWSGRRFDHDII